MRRIPKLLVALGVAGLTGFLAQGQTWRNADIGPVSIDGETVVSGDTITVTGDGADIWGACDEFQYYWATVTGDFDVQVEVESLDGTHQWAKAELMCRAPDPSTGEPECGDSFYAMMATRSNADGANGQNWIGPQWRAARDVDAASDNSLAVDVQYPNWLRLVREGSVFKGYYSFDGSDWTLQHEVDSATADGWELFPANAYVGLAVTSHTSSETATGTFTGFVFNAGGPAEGPPEILEQPVSQTAEERGSASFAVVVIGSPPSFQWEMQAADGDTWSDIEGATGVGLTVTDIQVAQDGEEYRCRISNSLGDATSDSATLTVNADTTPPTLADTQTDVSYTQVILTYSEPVEAASATDKANYAVDQGLTIGSIEMVGNDKVKLTTSTMTAGDIYTLTVNNVKDTAVTPNTIAPDSMIEFGGVMLMPGFVKMDIWWNVTGGIGGLTSDPRYPDNPDETSYPPAPDLSAEMGDNYGVRWTGTLTLDPGTYDFYVNSDNQSELYISTDMDPANLEFYCNEPEWNNYRAWASVERRPNTENASWSSAFPNGADFPNDDPRFLEILFHEGTGGDNFSVTWGEALVFDPQDGDPAAWDGEPEKYFSVLADPSDAKLDVKTPPADTTDDEGQTATFFVVAEGNDALGNPLTYQWQSAAAGSSSFADIPGATDTAYETDRLVQADDDGSQYQVVITAAPLDPVVSGPATLTVLPDTTPPVVVGASAFPGSTQVGVTFDEGLDAASASDPANYTVNGAAVASARLRTNVANELTDEKNLVELTVSASLDADFTLNVFGVKDLKGNAIPAPGIEVTGEALGLTITDVGSPDGEPGGPDPLVPSTVTTYGPGAFDVLCNGNDYWNNADGFNFVWEPRTGSFDVKVRVVSVSPINNWSAGAIMMREGPPTENGQGWELSRHYFCKVDYGGPDAVQVLDGSGVGADTYEYNARFAPGDPTLRETSNDPPGHSQGWGGVGPGNPSPVPFPNAWIRIARVKSDESDHLLGYSSSDGEDWDLRQDVDLNDDAHAGYLDLDGNPAGSWPDTVYVGLASTSHTGVGNNSEINDGAVGEFDYSPIGEPYMCYVIYRDWGDTELPGQEPTLTIEVTDEGAVVITWDQGILVGSSTVDGEYTDTGATSPYTVDTSQATTMFYQAMNP